MGESYLIAKYTGERVGTFGNVTPGYDVIYDDLAKQIRAEPIPQPASLVLAFVGMLAMGLWQWRRHGDVLRDRGADAAPLADTDYAGCSSSRDR